MLTDSSMPDFWVEHKPGALRRLGEQVCWWNMTYRDWLSLIPGKGRLWDIGCGFGQFVRVAHDLGWISYGIEPSDYARRRTVARDLDISGGTWMQTQLALIEVISALWLMEHLDNPGEFLDWVYGALIADGMFLAVVPNENTRIQRAANKIAKKKDWWIHPTHLNYWDRGGFYELLAQHGFEIVDELGTFPMEGFILAGMDYTDDPEIGKAAHKEIERMEMAMTRKERLELGRLRASRGWGRDLVVFARKR